MEVRASLRERLSAGHIDLRRFLRSMGSLTSKIDSHSKYVLQCARNTVATTNAPTENAAIRHVLTSVSGNSNFLANGRGQRGRRGQGRGRGAIESIRQDCQTCGKNYSRGYLPRHRVICKGPITIDPTTVEDAPAALDNVTAEFEGVDGRNVIFSFDIDDAINTDITLSQIDEDVFNLEQSIIHQQPGPSGQIQPGFYPPRQHNRYGSGDMSDVLIDDFGVPIGRIMTRSMSRSSQSTV